MLCVIACLFNGIDSSVSAQPIQRTGLSAWETELIDRHTNQYRETLKLARQHGWPLRKNYANRPVFQLQRVDSFGQPVYYTLHNREAAQSTRTTSLYGGGSLPVALTGGSPGMSGRLAMWDGGRVLATHQEFAGPATGKSRVTHTDQPTTVSDHATHLAGTLIAGGIRAEAKGMAYGATLSVWDYTNDIAELTAAAPKLLVSNHAYGPVVGWVYNPSRPGTDRNLKWEWWGNTAISPTDDYQFGFYTATARDLDQIAYNNPFLLMVRSADNKRSETGPPAQTPYFLKNTNVKSTVVRSRNDGYDVIPAEATAKNVLTVGAAEIAFNTQNQLTTLETAAYSGWGPTDDGRIKPDLLGIGTNVFSTVSGSIAGYGNNSGTSAASANVAGSLFLLQELFAQQRAKTGDPSAGGQFMRAATLRGLALHTANRLNPAAGPDYKRGWGLLNTEAAARVMLNTDLAHLIREQTLTASGPFVYRIVAQGSEPLVATLCWTDPEGPATPVAAASVNSRTPKLVNDLDLRLADGQITRLPFVLDPNRPGQSATPGDNSRDNVEQIYIANPVPGQAYTLSVTHKGKLTYAGQPFSIIVSGLRRAACQLTATIEPAGDALLCAGETLQLKAENRPGTQYEWLRDGVVMPAISGSVCPVDKVGSYTLRMTESTRCSALSRETSVRLSTVDVLPVLPEETDLLLLQGATVTLKAPAITGYRYQWYRNDLTISNATQHQFSVSQPGVYKVQATQQNCVGWSSERTVRMAVVLTATSPDPAASLTLYPNPAESLLSVQYTNSRVKQMQVSILDLRGILQQRPVRLRSGNGRFETNLFIADLPAGHYLLQLSDGAQLQTKRFVKK
ncbi:S8/S53 family peptidase [Spirosoma arcticum]